MAAGVPPPPLNSPSGSYYWLEWYTNLTNFINGTNIPWSNLNFTGSNLTDIQVRNHNDLQSIQGGDVNHRYHLAGVGSVVANAIGSFPSGWSLSHTAAGTYTITHNLTVTSPDFQVLATANTANLHVDYVTWTATTFTVHVVNASNAATDSDFSFICCQI